MILWSSIGVLLAIVLAALFVSRSISRPVLKLKENIVLLSKGELPSDVHIQANDTLGGITQALNLLIHNFSNALHFASEIEKGN